VSIAVLRHAVVSSFAYGGIESGIPFLQNVVVSLFACGGICLLAGRGAASFLKFPIWVSVPVADTLSYNVQALISLKHSFFETLVWRTRVPFCLGVRQGMERELRVWARLIIYGRVLSCSSNSLTWNKPFLLAHILHLPTIGVHIYFFKWGWKILTKVVHCGSMSLICPWHNAIPGVPSYIPVLHHHLHFLSFEIPLRVLGF